MTQERAFPIELLTQPLALRIAYFQNITLAHPMLKRVNDQVREALRGSGPGQLIFVTGPAGVGKSRFGTRLVDHLIAEAQAGDSLPPDRIPACLVEVPVPDGGRFSWKDLYWRMLEGLQEVLIEYKGSDLRHRQNPGSHVSLRAAGTPDLRRALESALRFRRPAAMILDEAQHLTKVAAGRSLLDQVDTVKSLANLSNTPIVLVGTYGLLAFFSQPNEQLLRRSVDIHFPRYNAENVADWEAFQSVFFTLLDRLPLAERPAMESHVEYVYERTIGAVGILKDWLVRAYAQACESSPSQPRLTVRDFEATALSADVCLYLLDSAQRGESQISPTRGAEDRLRAKLHFAEPSVLTQKPPARRVKPGRRRPTHDPVPGVPST